MSDIENKKSAIQDWFADCAVPEEVAELYAELLCEMRKQMKYMLDSFDEEE